MGGANHFYTSPGDPPSKQAILKAALTIFARDGVAGSSIRVIALESGYTNPAIFKFYRTKEALALFLFERCYNECLAVLRVALGRQDGFPSKLRAAVRSLTDFVDAHPEAFFFVQDNLRVYWPKLSKDTRRYSLMAEFRKLIELGRSEGRVSSNMPIELQLAAVLGFLSQLARMNYFEELKQNITRQTDQVESMILMMLQF